MQTYEFQLNNKRNVEREELYILTIIERVLAGYLSSISYVDQAQFCELLQRKQKEKQFIQPLHLQILSKIKRNLIKKQPQIKEQKVNYEIKRMLSQSIDSRKNYICLSNKNNRKYKELQMTQIDTQSQTVKDRRSILDLKSNQEGQRLLTNGSYHQNDSTTSRVIINSFQLSNRNKTQADDELKEISNQKQLTFTESNLKNRKQKPFINIVSQYGEIEKQVNNTKQQKRNYKTSFNDQLIKVNQNNDNYVIKYNQQHLKPQLNKNNDEIINNQLKIDNKDAYVIVDQVNFQNSQQQSQYLSMSNVQNRIDLKQKFQTCYSHDDDDFSYQSKPMIQSEGQKQITYGTHTELPSLDTDLQLKMQTIQSAKYLDKNKEQIYLKNEELNKNKQSQKQEYLNQIDQKSEQHNILEVHEIKQYNQFLSPTQQLNQQKIDDFYEQKQNSISKEDSQFSLLDQSLHKQNNLHAHLNVNRPATTHIDIYKLQEYPQFQTHDNIDQQQKQQQQQLIQQISMTSIMHDDEHYSNLNQQINIQVNQCEPAQNNVIIEESIECSPIYKIQNQQCITPSFNNLKLENQIQQNNNEIHTQQKQQIQQSILNQPSQTQIHLQSNQDSNNQIQQRMQIPFNNTQNSLKNNNKLTTNQKHQPESKLTIESSQGEKSNKSKTIKNSKQLKLHVAAATLTFSTKKSSNQDSPHDPTKIEQQEKEKQRQMEYQKQIEKMKYERELMEQYQIPDNMPLSQKRAIIEELIKQIELIADQDVQYQIMLYKQRQEQIQNATKQDIVFNRYLETCYEELGHLSEQKLKLLGKDDLNKVSFMRFENQVQTSFPNQEKVFSQEINSPIKKNLKLFSKFDPVEIENQLNRIKEFKQESEILKLFQCFNSQYDKEVNQCDLDYPTEKDKYNHKNEQQNIDQQRSLLIKETQKRKKNKQLDKKLRISTHRIDSQRMDTILLANDKIKSVGQYLL
ncbi:unnamed protein product [Paramecium pentaurelia]|uniref:Uncharacterized protein n=1 Tax=Paramecium pentaurelia TaxID=43138 RepID=A0A8S1W0R0_9CILI|nr:unnamed protein product [Paramecium pentaurelia]